MDSQRSRINSSGTKTGKSPLDYKAQLNRIKQNLYLSKPVLKDDPTGEMIKVFKRCHDHIIFIKENYPQDFEITKVTIYSKSLRNIPNWYKPILVQLQYYLDVKIFMDQCLPDRVIDPIKGYTIIGAKDNVNLAQSYFYYIFNNLEKTITKYVEDRKIEARQIRRKIRRGTTDNNRLSDTRLTASRLKWEMFNRLLKAFQKLLADIQIRHEDAWKQSVKFQKRVEARLEKYYGKKWETQVIKNYY